MEEIILQQKDAAKALGGKDFLLSVAGIVLRLALAQIAVNLVIMMTGVGLVNIAFYLYAVWLLVAFMGRTVASYVYTLKPGVLYLEKKLGDSTNTLVEIPLSRVISMRPVYMAEHLGLSYKQVTTLDPRAKPLLRVRMAFAASLLSAKLARLLAGKRAPEQRGYVIVFVEEGQNRACVFKPDAAMCQALEEQLGEVYGLDERLTQDKVRTLYARALERAFPRLYPYVEPLLKPGEYEQVIEQAQEEKAEKAEQKAKKKEREARLREKKRAGGKAAKAGDRRGAQKTAGAENAQDDAPQGDTSRSCAKQE